MNFKQIKLTYVRYIFLLISFGISFSVYSQTYLRGKIIDSDSKLPIPFASVVYQNDIGQNGTVSDVFGKFEIVGQNVKNLTVSCIGYKTQKILIQSEVNQIDIIVKLEASVQELNEVVVTSKNNPAIRIVKNTLKNKKLNNFENYPDYSYQCYFKTIIDYKLTEESSRKDSVKLEKNKLLKTTTPFISEIVISTLKRNKQLENKITAEKTSGFKNPLLPQTFVSLFHQAISFYNNSISLFQIPIDDNSTTEYVSPLSDGCLSAYSYELEDNYLNGLDTIFIIHFKPKKGQTFNGLKGSMFIHSNGFALKNIVVEPSDKPLMRIKFRQDYECVDNKWFPTKLEEEIGWMIYKKSNIYPSYIVSSSIDNISFQFSNQKQKINLEKVYLDENAMKKSDEILNKSRLDTLTTREKNSYHYMDSLGRKYHLDDWFGLLPKLADGKIPYKWIDFNLNDIYTENKYEGSRIGIGLSTNDNLLKNILLGGLIGYGTKDKKLKYGGAITFDINKYREIQLNLSYQNNLKEVGSNGTAIFETSTLSDYLRTYMAYRFDHSIKKSVDFAFKPLRNFTIKTSFSVNHLSPLYTYNYKNAEITNYDADAFEFSAKYAFGERLQTIGGKRFVNFEGNPIISFKYKRGVKILNKSSLTYNNYETIIDYSIFNGRIGQSKFRLASGFIDRNLPYGLLFTGEGSKSSNFSFIINNSFQTMMPYEFLSDKYVHLFYSHNFGNLLLNTKIFKPQFILVQNTGWGTLKNPSEHGIDFKTMEKIYLESGLIINNILKIKYMNVLYINLGAGGFLRHGNYKLSDFNDNLALKLSLTVSLK